MAELKGLPPGGQLWQVDNLHYVVYFIPGTQGMGEGPGIPIAWWINDPKVYESLLGPGKPFQPERKMTSYDLRRIGTVQAGVVGDIANTDTNPFDGLVQRFEREARIKPYLRNPEVLSSIAEAAMEGRPWDAETDLPLTSYWRYRTPGQREWDLLAASDPKAAEQRMATGTQKVRELLSTRGVGEVPGLTDELAHRWITGEWTEQQLVDNIRRGSDPYAPGHASFGQILANQPTVAGDHVIHRGTHYLLHDRKAYYVDPNDVRDMDRLYGPAREVNDWTMADWGQHTGVSARSILDPADTSAFPLADLGISPVSEHVRFITPAGEQQHFLISGGRAHIADPNDIGDLTRIMGPPRDVSQQELSRMHIGAPTGTVRQLLDAGDPSAFPLGDVTRAPGQVAIDPTRLGGEEQVRGLLRQWLGPMYARGFSNAWIEQWAGRIRNGAEGEADVLTEQLRAQAAALFGRDGDYESLAGPWRGFWQRYAGAAPDEEKDSLFLRILNLNDAAQAESLLRREGRQKNWAPVAQEFLGASQQALGGQVMAGAGAR